MNTATGDTVTGWVPNEPPSVDWLGRNLDCDSCVNQGLLAEGKCQLAFSCVFDRYAKRIDRFFRWNPGLANDYLEHPYFEVRAVASRSADVFRLVGLMHDPDETVRLHVALRLPQRLLAELRNDPDREVRIRVAQRLDASMLVEMVNDPDYFVRKLVAQRLPLPLLPRMAADPDQEVRLAVAGRLQVPACWRCVTTRRWPCGVRWFIACRLASCLTWRTTQPGRCAGRSPNTLIGPWPSACSWTMRPKSVTRPVSV
jgi:hypothetical protein